MTLAEIARDLFLNGRAKDLGKAARLAERDFRKDRDGPYTFFHFSDGSYLASSGRGTNHQIWTDRKA